MAELSIVASVIQIADVGLRLSIKLYTFGEIVSTADRSVISISKDVSLTSSVLKELGALLDRDTSSRIVSENAVQTADKVVKECLEVFEEIETVLVNKMPNLRASAEEKRPKAVMLLEKVKWTYLQPKLQLLRSNLDRLKSTLLLMLNVITYARQVAGRSEPPSVIENQRSLIEDLARSNQDYIRKFEILSLRIEDKPRTQEGCSQKDDSSTKMSWLQERPQVNVHGTGPRKRCEPQEVHAPHVSTGDIFLSTSAQNMPRTLELQGTKPQQEMQNNSRVEDELFSHLKHYLSLVNNLLDEVDELRYDIRFDSRDRAKVEILQTYEREIELLDTPDQHIWSLMAAKPIAPLVDSLQKHLHRAQQQQSQPSIKHHQHENKVRAASLQKIHLYNSNRAPAAPTTSLAPFSFGGQSPNGVPYIYGPTKNQVTQEKLVLPVAKKRRSNKVASPLTLAQVPNAVAANKLSPFGKIESPDEQRTPSTKSIEQETPGLVKPVNAAEPSLYFPRAANSVVMNSAQPQAHTYGQHPFAPHMQASSNAKQSPTIVPPSSQPPHIQNQPQASTILPSQIHSHQTQQPPQGNHPGLGYPQSYYSLPPTSMARSLPQVPSLMRPLPSQVSPDGRLDHDSTPTHATHSALRDKEGRSNGCLTCCVRRVKCDEGLPICQNCIQFGSRCEADGSLNLISSGITPDSGFYDFASPEEGYKSPYPLAQFKGASTGGPSEPSLARSADSGEKVRNSHSLPDMQFSNWRPPPGQIPPPSSPLRNPIPSVMPSSSLSEGLGSQFQQAPSPPILQQQNEVEPATYLTAPQVINIRKAQPKKFYWKKGGHNVAKGVPSFHQFLGPQQDALRHQENGQVVIPASQGPPPQIRGSQQRQAQQPQSYFTQNPYNPHPIQLQQPFQSHPGLPPGQQQQMLAPQPQPPPQPNSSPSRKRKASGVAPIAAMSFLPSTSLGESNDGGHQVEEPIEAFSSMPGPGKSRTNTPWTPAEEQRLKVMRDAGNSRGGSLKVTRQKQPSYKDGDEASLVGSRVSRSSASQEPVSDSETERQTMLNSSPCMSPCMDYGSETQAEFGLNNNIGPHCYDPDDASRGRSVVDDLIELWTLLPVQ